MTLITYPTEPITYMSDNAADEAAERLNSDDPEYTYKVIRTTNNLAYIAVYDEAGELLGTL